MNQNQTNDLFSNLDAVVDATRRAAQNLIPPPDMLPSVWAEANIRIPVGNAIPGPINFDNAPYQRGMLDVMKEPGIRRVSYMTGAQLGKTTVQQCGVGYFISHEPQSQIFVQPTQGDIQTFLETKLRPMIDANPVISNKMAKQRGRDGVNNSRIISYIGGWLMFGWAGSPKTVRSRSAPKTHADEIDGYDVSPEGDIGELLTQRTATFGDQALNTESSTPTIKGASRIDTAFDEGDQRRYYIACPDCDEPQYLKWENVRWDGRASVDIKTFEHDIGVEHAPETAMYCCEHCGTLWDDGQRIAAIRNAEKRGHGWKAAKPFKGHASFHAPEMLSTFRRLREIVQSYLDKLAKNDMQSFVNVSLGEAYEESGEKADPDSLMQRRYAFPATVPAGALYLTAGIDMQQDRLEVEIVGWGIAEQSWSIEYRVLWGDPLSHDVWMELDDLLEETFQHESGYQLPINAACLDTGGTDGYTQSAYEYAKGKTGRRLFAVKGVGGWGRAIVEKPQRKQTGKNARKVDLFLVGTDEAKLIITRRLGVAKPGPGYCHFPLDDDHDDDYFKQLTAEKLVTRYVKGQPVREWHKHDKARNEALDCRVYAFAALKIMQPSFKRLAERLAVAQVEQIPEKSTENWSKTVAETAIRLKDALVAVRDAEKPQEAKQQSTPENKPIIKTRRTLSKKGSAKNWATKW